MTPQFKTIVKGCLEFGNKKSFSMMQAQLLKRQESYYKNDILLKDLSYFQEENFTIEVPRSQFIYVDKTYKNTLAFLYELRDFALAGSFHLWVVDEKNTVKKSAHIIPNSDKSANVEYNNGNRFIERKDYIAAIGAFGRAIDKYDQYTQAYERRGYAYFLNQSHEDALMDYSKSLSLRLTPEAFFGRAEVLISVGDYKGAVLDLQNAIDNSLPYQSIFWSSRRLKGVGHFKIGEFDKAANEFKYFTKRHFSENDMNYAHKIESLQMYLKSLQKIGEDKTAKEVLLKLKELGITEVTDKFHTTPTPAALRTNSKVKASAVAM